MTTLRRLISRLPKGQWALRGTLVAGIVLALLAPGLDGQLPRGWLIGVGSVLALGAAIAPDGDAATTACCWVLVAWVATDRVTIGAGALVAAAGLVIAHLAAALAAYGPGRMTPDRRLVLLWLRRGLLVLVPSAVVVLVSSLLPVPAGSTGSWLWVAAAVLVAGLAIGVSIVHRTGS